MLKFVLTLNLNASYGPMSSKFCQRQLLTYKNINVENWYSIVIFSLCSRYLCNIMLRWSPKSCMTSCSVSSHTNTKVSLPEETWKIRYDPYTPSHNMLSKYHSPISTHRMSKSIAIRISVLPYAEPNTQCFNGPVVYDSHQSYGW